MVCFRYRSIEGICNNLDNPHWGAAMNGHHRYIPIISFRTYIQCSYTFFGLDRTPFHFFLNFSSYFFLKKSWLPPLENFQKFMEFGQP